MKKQRNLNKEKIKIITNTEASQIIDVDREKIKQVDTYIYHSHTIKIGKEN